MSDNGIPKPPPTGERTAVLHPDEDARVVWEQGDAYNGAQSVSLAEERGQLRGKYDALKQFARYVETMRDKFERRADRFERRATWQGYTLLGIAVAVIVLWSVSSVIYQHPIPPWQMFSIFGPGVPPPPPGGPPHGHP